MTEADSGRPAPRAVWLAIAFVLVCVCLAFVPTFDAEFLNFDDDLNITENHAFRGLDGEHLTWMFTTNWLGPYQPLSWLSLAADHALWGLSGPREYPEAPYYHRTNVALHALTAGAFVLLALALFRHAGSRASAGRRVLAAAAAALWFGVHPLRVESVAWVTERRDVLSGLFFVLALVAWLRHLSCRAEGGAPRTRPALAILASTLALVAFLVSVDRGGASSLAWSGPGPWGLAAGGASLAVGAWFAGGRRHYFLALGLFLLALLSKGLVVVLPIVLLVLDAWQPTRSSRETLLARVLEQGPFLALSVAFGQLALWGQASQAGTMADLGSHTLAERAAQAAYGLAHYPLRTLAPIGLQPIYELPESLSLAQPRFAVALVIVVVVTVAVVRLRRRFPAALAAWVAFAVIIAPVLGITQAGPQLVADRYSYLACMPLALLAGGGLLALLARGGAIAGGALTVAVLSLGALGAGTWRYAQAWHDSTSLWTYTVELDPDNGAAWLNRATAQARLAERERDTARRETLLTETLQFLERGFELRPDPRYLGNMARVHAMLGHRELALDHSRRALALAREQGVLVANYHLSLGLDLFGVGRLEEALASFEVVLDAEPKNYRALVASGQALLTLGRFAPAAVRLRQATRLEPGSVLVWRQLAKACEAGGDRDAAIAAWRRVLELAPGHAGAREHLSGLGATP